MPKLLLFFVSTFILLFFSTISAKGIDIKALVEQGNYQAIEQAIKDGANLDMRPDDHKANYYEKTALIVAISEGKNNIVALLLKNGADPNLYYSRGITPLMEAISENNLEALKLLLQHRANIHATDGDGKQALAFAVRNGHIKIIKILLKHGAKINHQDDMGFTALHYATVSKNQKIFDFLLKNGADKTIKDQDGNTAEFFDK